MPQQSHGHTGIDIGYWDDPHGPLYAVDYGRVVYAGPLYCLPDNSELSCDRIGRGRNAIIIWHDFLPGNVYTIYSHNSEVEPWIKHQLELQSRGEGDYPCVSPGRLIGRQGKDGWGSSIANNEHLHFEVLTGCELIKPVDPFHPFSCENFVDPKPWLGLT